ncbi:ATP-binding protein [Flavobacterium sp.]|uniref:ATP-binding protein n=1 Tax=Flavobacterium sp. TaxID=239 RepID=UPI00261BD736|nr:ATP-binding protein [Flavobacterium sp.]
MIDLERDLKKNLLEKWNSGKVLILIGPRQVGKTTLIRSLCEAEGNYLFINGDDAEDRMLLENAGESKLRNLIGSHKTVFFDEAQRIANIGIILKIIHDQIKGVRVVVSGSSALEIANEINEPLTGRKWEFNLFPFSWNELLKHFGALQNFKNIPQYLLYGTYPEVITNVVDAENTLKQIAGSYLYKDLLQYQGIRKPEVLDKLLLALALQMGSEVNYNELSRTVGVDRATVEQYISLLEKAYVIFRLAPLARNVRNEMNTSRKIYFYDNGIRNAIIGNFKSLEFRQDVGALWENFMISERLKILNYKKWHGRTYFWRTYQQQEIDWIEEIDGAFSAFEFKWNVKNSYKKFPKTFIDNYTIHQTMVVTPNNCDVFLLE